VDTEQNRISRAKGLYREGKLQESEALFRTALASPMLKAEAITGIGMIRLQAGDVGEATRMFETALNYRPNADAHYGLGVIAERGQSVGKALAHFQKALALNAHHQGAFKRMKSLEERSTAARPIAGPPTQGVTDAPATPVSVATAQPAVVSPEDLRSDQAAFYQILGADKSALSQQALKLIDSITAEGAPRLSAYPLSVAILVLGVVIPAILLLLALSQLG
jgi:Tfp pilus assembly protein PilF